MEAFSRKIIGWSMGISMEAQLVVDALEMAIARRKPNAGLIHHSDRGSQSEFNPEAPAPQCCQGTSPSPRV